MASNKYVPPGMRKTEHPAIAPVQDHEKTLEDDFPRLNTVQTSRRVWGGSSSFAEKAREWSEKAKEDEVRLAAQEYAAAELQPAIPVVRNLPRFHNVRRFVEEDDVDETVEKPSETNDDESGWTVVQQKKKRKQKSLTEIADDDFAKGIVEESSENDDSVWANDKNLYETCWDERV